MDGHAGGTALCTMQFCQLLALPAEQSELLIHAAWWHDVGKLDLPSSIWSKPTRLSAEERRLARTHPERGAERLRRLGLPVCADVALSHHECWDGTGYPRGLKGHEIPRSARIVSISDVYSALREDRPYKPGMTHQEAAQALLVGDPSGRTGPRMFDPDLLAIFGQHQHRFAAAWAEWPSTVLTNVRLGATPDAA